MVKRHTEAAPLDSRSAVRSSSAASSADGGPVTTAVRSGPNRALLRTLASARVAASARTGSCSTTGTASSFSSPAFAPRPASARPRSVSALLASRPSSLASSSTAGAHSRSSGTSISGACQWTLLIRLSRSAKAVPEGRWASTDSTALRMRASALPAGSSPSTVPYLPSILRREDRSIRHQAASSTRSRAAPSSSRHRSKRSVGIMPPDGSSQASSLATVHTSSSSRVSSSSQPVSLATLRTSRTPTPPVLSSGSGVLEVLSSRAAHRSTTWGAASVIRWSTSSGSTGMVATSGASGR